MKKWINTNTKPIYENNERDGVGTDETIRDLKPVEVSGKKGSKYLKTNH